MVRLLDLDDDLKKVMKSVNSIKIIDFVQRYFEEIR